MKLADQLHKIAEAGSEELIRDFEQRIQGHKEEKLLAACLEEAKCAHMAISFGRNCVPPSSLRDEGFHLKAESCGFIYCWG